MTLLTMEETRVLSCGPEEVSARAAAAAKALGYRASPPMLPESPPTADRADIVTEWYRGAAGFGSRFWSLPDRCPSELEIRVAAGDTIPAPPDRPSGSALLCRVAVRVAMTGQIVANTDVKTVEMEIDRFWWRMEAGEDFTNETAPAREGEFLERAREERRRLSRLTLGANLLLTGVPAITCASAMLAAHAFASHLSTAGEIAAAIAAGGITWLVSLGATARWVVGGLDRAVKTRFTRRDPSGSHSYRYTSERDETGGS